MAWLTTQQIIEMGFASVGSNLLLSDKASYYNCTNIRLGSNIRIDDFCVLSAGDGGIDIGNYIHIAVYSSLIGAGNITLADFSNISSRVAIYSSNDDYSGAAMTNPTVQAEFTKVRHANVKIGRHVIIGAGTIILPGVTLEEGVAVGALSLVKKDCKTFGVYIGSPAKRIGVRKRDLLTLEKQFLFSIAN
jgi:acetyltransferase-like isoleucine patch superfamily enzyme